MLLLFTKNIFFKNFQGPLKFSLSAQLTDHRTHTKEQNFFMDWNKFVLCTIIFFFVKPWNPYLSLISLLSSSSSSSWSLSSSCLILYEQVMMGFIFHCHFSCHQESLPVRDLITVTAVIIEWLHLCRSYLNFYWPSHFSPQFEHQ